MALDTYTHKNATLIKLKSTGTTKPYERDTVHMKEEDGGLKRRYIENTFWRFSTKTCHTHEQLLKS